MISFIVISYNSAKFLPACFESLGALHLKDKEIFLIDNASHDDSIEVVRRKFPRVKIVANTKNLGYAGAANQGINMSSGEFVMIVNPDIIFEPNYVEILLKRLREDHKIAAIIGKLKKFDVEKGQGVDVIDSAGLVMYRSRRCVDRGQGEEDHGQYDEAEEVFGVTGACPLYRRSALEDAAIRGEYLDEDFFMYKEDVDIAWRFRLLGWKSFYEPEAVAYHARGTGILKRASLGEVARGRAQLSRFQKYYSYKNERLMRVKNELFGLVARDFLPICWKEMLMAGWMLTREPFLLKAVFHALWQMPRAWRKRREIMRKRRSSIKEMGQWFSSAH